MAIITKTSDGSINSLTFNNYPDQFVSDKKKRTDGWIKEVMDFFANIAYHSYANKKDTIVKNYNLVNGILSSEDFYDDEVVKSFIKTLTYDVELPKNVKHYPILNPPINTLTGELANRPDITRVKAMDADSQAEEIKAKTEIMFQYIIQETKEHIMTQYAGQEISEEELDKITMEKVQETLTDYTSQAEKWANKVLESCKVEFNMKELSEEGFRDLLIASQEYFHIYEDNSKTGFNIENLNPKNEWHIYLNNKKYTSDVTGTGRGTPAAGIVTVMELTEIMERFKLTNEEIDHLKKGNNENNYLTVGSSFATREVGIGSIKYPQGSKLLELERMILDSQLTEENNDDISNVLGLSTSVTSFGNKFVVVQAYFVSKQEVYNVTYLDEEGQPQTMMVDGDYEDVPNQIDKEKGWINRWMVGTKIGPHVYNVEYLNILDYCPIIGVVHGGKNSKARSLVDLMKPLQTLYNICMNQLFRLMEKEWGMFTEIPIKKIITPKDGDSQDALDLAEGLIKEAGVLYTDESLENTKVQLPNTSVVKVHDATVSQQIMSRYQTALMLKNECWELVGITRQRLGGTSGATETATATQAGLSQSFTQTEPIFSQHQYLLNQVYQAIIDASQYIAINKPVSTISYLTGDGSGAFLQINGSDLSTRDLKTFVTSRAEDVKVFNELRQLGQAVLQNEGDLYDVSVLYTTNSLRQMQGIFEKLKKERQALQQQQQQIEQTQLQQQQAQFEQQMQYNAENDRVTRETDNLNKDLDRINKKEVAIINSFSKQDDNTKDTDGSGVPDILEISRLDNEVAISNREHTAKLMELQQKTQSEAQKIQLEREKLQVARENMVNDKDIAKINAKNKPKPKKK